MRTLDGNLSSSEQTCEDSSSLPRATVIFDRRADRRASTCDDQNGRQTSWRFESRPVASLLLRHWTPGIHKDIFLPVSHHQFPTYQPPILYSTLLRPSSIRFPHDLVQVIGDNTTIMLLQLILALTGTAANAFVIPQNIATGSVQPLYERTPLPPHAPGLHIPVTDNQLNTYSASDMVIFLKAHNKALEMCAMVIDGARKQRCDQSVHCTDKVTSVVHWL
jgi:hypothetical protein